LGEAAVDGHDALNMTREWRMFYLKQPRIDAGPAGKINLYIMVNLGPQMHHACAIPHQSSTPLTGK
jgi:hypothetical protein